MSPSSIMSWSDRPPSGFPVAPGSLMLTHRTGGPRRDRKAVGQLFPDRTRGSGIRRVGLTSRARTMDVALDSGSDVAARIIITAALWTPFLIRPREQVAERLPHQIRQPLPAAVLLTIVDHVAALAEGLEVARPIVGRIVVEVRGCEHHTRCQRIRAQAPARAVAPGPCRRARLPQPRPTTARRPGASPAGHVAGRNPRIGPSPGRSGSPRQLSPVDRVQPAVLGPDGQISSLSGSRGALGRMGMIAHPMRTRATINSRANAPGVRMGKPRNCELCLEPVR